MFSPYYRGKTPDKQPRYNIQRLSDYGWCDIGLTTPEGRTIFELPNGAILIRHEGGCLVLLGDGITMFFPSDYGWKEMTDKVIGLMSKRAEEIETPDDYGLGVA